MALFPSLVPGCNSQLWFTYYPPGAVSVTKNLFVSIFIELHPRTIKLHIRTQVGKCKNYYFLEVKKLCATKVYTWAGQKHLCI